MKEGDDKCYFVVTRGCIDDDIVGKVVDAYFVELGPRSVGQTGILEGNILAEKRPSVVVERSRAPVEEGGVISKQQGGTDDTDNDAGAKLDRRSDATGSRWLGGKHILLLLGGVKQGYRCASLEIVEVIHFMMVVVGIAPRMNMMVSCPAPGVSSDPRRP